MLASYLDDGSTSLHTTRDKTYASEALGRPGGDADVSRLKASCWGGGSRFSGFGAVLNRARAKRRFQVGAVAHSYPEASAGWTRVLKLGESLRIALLRGVDKIVHARYGGNVHNRLDVIGFGR